MPRAHSPARSPARKRQRLSSPSYDDVLGELRLSQEDLEAFDKIEAEFSQSQANSHSHPSSSAARPGSGAGLPDDPDNPFASASTTAAAAGPFAVQFNGFGPASGFRAGSEAEGLATGFASAAQYSGFGPASGFRAGSSAEGLAAGLASAAQLSGFGPASGFRAGSETLAHHHDYAPSPSPEAPPEPDYDAWFAPAHVSVSVPPAAFQAAFAPASAVPQGAPIGFMKASNKGWIAPSKVAFAKAQEKMNAIWAEDPNAAAAHPSPLTESDAGVENVFRTASNLNTPRLVGLASPERPALRVLDNAFNSPGTPSPASGFQRASASSASALPAFSSPSIGQLRGKARPFKSPLLPPSANAGRPGLAGSPLNPKPRAEFVAAGTQHPLAAPPVVASMPPVPNTPLRAGPSALALVTPVRASPQVQVRVRPPAFVTPFKTGMKPGEPGRKRLEEKAKAVEVRASASTPAKPLSGGAAVGGASQSRRKTFFDLTRREDRKTLLSSGLAPQEYTIADLEDMGIAGAELKHITPTLALYYSFHTPSATPPSDASPSPSPPKLLGPDAALGELLGRGCSLATKAWVDNHWCLILWKLAGMVCLEPERESDPQTKRWCWAEVIRQLLYRYERELNGGVRPPLRSIATQDAPASCPMVLCVSNITWSEPGVGDDGLPIPPHPELEVTDGWYRLRAQVDAPLARAVRRGVLRVGRKFGVVGARLDSERKEPSEVLEAYNSTKLVITGNSSHLVPWHAKLGFQAAPWIATMNSLTADGGLIASMDVVVLKTYPVAFLEFFEDENGEKQREGPWNERDEAKAEEQWQRRREVHVSKLRVELEKKEMRYQGYAERLERRAGVRFAPSVDDDAPDEIEELYDELEDPVGAAAVLRRISANSAGWLARFIVDRVEKERERAGDEIEQELKRLCPPREVRNFRVLVVQDACTRRRGAHRSAQVTVWDALGTGFEVGQRYGVSNLVPTAQSAWMDCEAGSEIYLSTRRDSRWKRV
ncbi:hypothetical protein B0H15DRAFT_811512 [Mycena belliarum]|uniref:BRCA2 OB1 domain-containing protein n=1 Tax=Mycena belliarum TaxID=1033014 RepID=A0AAD6UH34_9AGAR|nr:hypothetical protein B0H15DRAFT_811512 [Mycena belliae]